MANKKTSINLSEAATKKLAEITKQTGLSQTQIIEALLSQAESIQIIVNWKEQHVSIPSSPKKKKG